MLVLARKPGEEIFIGENIVIKVLSTSTGTVRIGISAPRDTEIKRSGMKPKKRKEAA